MQELAVFPLAAAVQRPAVAAAVRPPIVVVASQRLVVVAALLVPPYALLLPRLVSRLLRLFAPERLDLARLSAR